ncbi:MAG: hypothetical protein L0Y71_04765 [Gemmataceae bacterium]|nr:hypothetical protein [Gemmataceae bacterium]
MSKTVLRTKRKFSSIADEIEYVYQKLLHWFYPVRDPAKARRYASRLKRLLQRRKKVRPGIFTEECWSLVCEVEGDYLQAIRHRKNEIRLIRRLHSITSKDQWELVSRFYGYDDLSDRLDLLALLYDGIGQTDRAIKILRESKALCDRHGIPFDGEEILQELLSDPQGNGTRNGRVKSRKH